MRIVHICLACFYVDRMAYQENIITKYHSKDHEVMIVTSDYAFDSSGKRIKKEKNEYLNEYGILVKVLPRSHRYGFYSKYNDFDHLYKTLCTFQPDVIFCHGGQFVALKDVIRYCKKNNQVKLFIDQHGDYYNTPVNTKRQRWGQYWIYGYWMRKAAPYTKKFWGVTPWRCQYLNDVYKIPKNKIDLLIMGGDDDKIHIENCENIRKEIRDLHAISQNDFLIVTGGKIDETKRIDVLMEAVKNLNIANVKLLVFGQPSKEMASTIEAFSIDDHIRHIGWISSEKVYDYFLASDLAVFPGTHSVLWEQACACGVPGIFKDWEGMHHVDVGGNALFLKESSIEEIKKALIEVIDNKEKYEKMKEIAMASRNIFSYKAIAERAISE